MNAQIYEIAYWVNETEAKKLKNTLNTILEEAKFTRLNYIDNNFTPQGYTGLWLLAESHLAVHTFPEQGKTYVQLSCCSKEKYQAFLGLFQREFTVLHDTQ